VPSMDHGVSDGGDSQHFQYAMHRITSGRYPLRLLDYILFLSRQPHTETAMGDLFLFAPVRIS
jgi:hypothetical protein